MEQYLGRGDLCLVPRSGYGSVRYGSMHQSISVGVRAAESKFLIFCTLLILGITRYRVRVASRPVGQRIDTASFGGSVGSVRKKVVVVDYIPTTFRLYSGL